MATFICPQCGHSQAVDDKHIGRNATCPKCKTQGVVERQVAAFPVPHNVDSGHEPVIRRGFGGPVGIQGLLVNKDSTLHYEWIIIDDPRMPATFTGVCGVTPAYDALNSSEYSQSYTYVAKYEWQAGDTPLSAIEIRFLTFDVWGSHVRTLCAEEIKDIAPGSKQREESTWRLYSDSEAWHHFASIAYVARVRTRGGAVINADADVILREAQRFTEKFTEADLEAKPPKKDS